MTTHSRTLFAEEFRLEQLSKKHDPLERLNEHINWEMFRPLLNSVLTKEAKGAGGRPAYDFVLMFKILILQRYYHISDEQVEIQVLDRLSFMRFLGLGLSDSVPDHNTVWLFREKVTTSGVMEKLFTLFTKQLETQGLLLHEGSIVDASIVDVPKQRNSREENAALKENTIPATLAENPNVLRHKDVEARWVKKNGINYFGYKNHIKVSIKSKFIERYSVTAASVHDSQALESLVDATNSHRVLYADSAYSGEPIATLLEENAIENCVHEKGVRNAKLTKEQMERNRIKSKVRARVEHVFGFIEKAMKGSYVSTIGLKRAATAIGLMNLTYNLFRYLHFVQS